MLNESLNKLLELNRTQKRAIQLVTDTLIILFSFVLAMVLRLEGFAGLRDPQVWQAMVVVIPASLFVFVRLGFYRAVIRFITLRAVRAILIGVLISACLLFAVSEVLNLPVPRSVPAIYALVALVILGGTRIVMRRLFRRPGGA